jgi:hypothetical protein
MADKKMRYQTKCQLPHFYFITKPSVMRAFLLERVAGIKPSFYLYLNLWISAYDILPYKYEGVFYS